MVGVEDSRVTTSGAWDVLTGMIDRLNPGVVLNVINCQGVSAEPIYESTEYQHLTSSRVKDGGVFITSHGHFTLCPDGLPGHLG